MYYIRTIIRIAVIPIMILFYIGIVVPLSIVIMMDWIFDFLGWVAGWDTRFWPLPKGQDEDFRFRKAKCSNCRKTVI